MKNVRISSFLISFMQIWKPMVWPGRRSYYRTCVCHVLSQGAKRFIFARNDSLVLVLFVLFQRLFHGWPLAFGSCESLGAGERGELVACDWWPKECSGDVLRKRWEDRKERHESKEVDILVILMMHCICLEAIQCMALSHFQGLWQRWFEMESFSVLRWPLRGSLLARLGFSSLKCLYTLFTFFWLGRRPFPKHSSETNDWVGPLWRDEKHRNFWGEREREVGGWARRRSWKLRLHLIFDVRLVPGPPPRGCLVFFLFCGGLEGFCGWRIRSRQPIRFYGVKRRSQWKVISSPARAAIRSTTSNWMWRQPREALTWCLSFQQRWTTSKIQV